MNYGDPAITEVYEVVKTIEVHLASNRVFRLEALLIADNPDAPEYSVRYYERQTLYKAKNAPGGVSTQQSPEASEVHVWVPDQLPWVRNRTADGALQQALGFVTDRRDNQNRHW
jgi:hypothetical protein